MYPFFSFRGNDYFYFAGLKIIVYRADREETRWKGIKKSWTYHRISKKMFCMREYIFY